MILFELPTEIFSGIFEEWLNPRSLGRFGCAAAGNHACRDRLRTCFSSPYFIARYSFILDRPNKLRWLFSSGITFQSYDIFVEELAQPDIFELHWLNDAFKKIFEGACKSTFISQRA